MLGCNNIVASIRWSQRRMFECTGTATGNRENDRSSTISGTERFLKLCKEYARSVYLRDKIMANK